MTLDDFSSRLDDTKMPAIQISALNEEIAVVHIPVERAQDFATWIYWTIDQAATDSDEFFNITSNCIEIAIFGSLGLIDGIWTSVDDPDVKISASWRVFEISSGDSDESGGNYDSPHLRYVSAPLAHAGISILYQSSYFTDFLLVKDTSFLRAAGIFASRGWPVDFSSPQDPAPRCRLSYTAPFSPPLASPRTGSFSPAPPVVPQILALPSSLACIGLARSTESRTSERVRKFLVWPERYRSVYHAASQSALLPAAPAPAYIRPFMSYTRTQDGASLSTEIRVLRAMFEGEEGDLQCGGEFSLPDDDDFAAAPEITYGSRTSSFGELPTPPLEPDHKSAFHPSSLSRLSLERPMTPPEPEKAAPGRISIDLEPSVDVSSRNSIDGWSPSPVNLRYSLPATPECGDGADTDMLVHWSDVVETGNLSPVSNDMSVVNLGAQAGRKRCLQLDMRALSDHHDESSQAYHMDKSGLLTRFSTLLQRDNIRMLYSSTFHTANILVEASDVSRAKRLLERKDDRSWPGDLDRAAVCATPAAQAEPCTTAILA